MANFVSAPKALKSMAQGITTSWAAVGDPFKAGLFERVIIRPDIDINASTDVQFRLIERLYVATAGNEYSIMNEIDDGSTVYVEAQTVEISVDSDQKDILSFDIQGLQWLELQMKAAVSGGILNSVHFNFVKVGS